MRISRVNAAIVRSGRTSITEEKERRTLEFLLATDLRDREIVLSKLCARTAWLLLLVITGLPILSILQLYGGISLQLLLAGFALTGLTLVSLASLTLPVPMVSTITLTGSRTPIA